MRRAACWAALLLLSAACQTTVKPGSQDVTTPVVVAEPVQAAGTARIADVREQVDELLAEARAAASRGDLAAAEGCQREALDRVRALGGSSAEPGERDDLLADVLDELERLAETTAEEVEGEEEVPPEPQPVPPEAVAVAQSLTAGERFDLPVVVNAEVTSLIEYYSGPYRERFALALERAARYLPFIRQELQRAGMPVDLAYLPLVESAFNPSARSRARAQGLWQFMAGTGKLYDLHVNGLLDERNDPYLATTAAVRHLKDLHTMFGDWELALAAYNSGAGRVMRALKRGKGVTDFWGLRRYLPRETRNYVPAMWAALVVAKNPEAYGFVRVPDKPDCLARVPIDGALDLEVLAERAGLPAEQLAGMNPALVHRLTPANGRYQLAVPCGQEQAVAATVASIPPGERIRHYLHVVKKGDTPSAIARRYGSTVDAIMAANGLRNPRSLRIGQTLVVPRTPGAVLAASRRNAPAEPAQPRKARGTPPAAAAGRYVVRSGDTLYDIARRNGTTVAELKKLNNLVGSRITPGDVLVLSR